MIRRWTIRLLAVAVSVLAVIAVPALAIAKRSHRRSHDQGNRSTLVVVSGSDGPAAATTPGTLRWAITTNNNLTQSQRNRDPRTILIEPSAGIIAIASQMPALSGPLKVVGAGNEWNRPTVGLNGAQTDNPYATGGASCPSTDGNLPATPVTNGGAGPNVRGIDNPLLAIENPVIIGTDPTSYGTDNGTASGTPNAAFGVAADYSGTEPNGHVTIDHLVLENSCIGILSLRSHDNLFEHNLLYNNVGAAGIIVTGDAGDATGSGTTGVSIDNTTAYNTFLDNGDHMEYTRGTSDSAILHNRYFEDPEPLGAAASGANTGATDTSGTLGKLQAGDLPSQSVEFAGAGDNDNRVIGNHMFGGMSDGLQLSGTGEVVEDNYITGDAEAIDLNTTNSLFKGNVITANHEGLAGRGTGDTLTRNAIFGEGAPVSICNAGGICNTNPNYATSVLGIDLGGAGVTADPGCTTTVQNFPDLSVATVSPAGSLIVRGTLSCTPNGSFQIDLFANHVRSTSGNGEGESFLTATTVQTDASGNATFSVTVPSHVWWHLAWSEPFISATATNTATGSTSEFSADIAVP